MSLRGTLVLIATIVVSFPLSVSAYTSPGYPAGYVNDFAHVLSDDAKRALETELKSYEASTSNQITVVTVLSLGDDYIENYAVKLFEEWKIGTKEKDNGVLFLLAMNDRKMRIEVGYGLEGALPDSVAQNIISSQVAPLLKQGRYDEAVATGVSDIEAAIGGEYTNTENVQISLGGHSFDFYLTLLFGGFVLLQWIAAVLARSKSWWAGGVVGSFAGVALWTFTGVVLAWGVGMILGLMLIGLVLDYVVSRGYTSAVAGGSRVPWYAGGSRGFGGGGSGGGFGGFGGGRSGGGGASGGW